MTRNRSTQTCFCAQHDSSSDIHTYVHLCGQFFRLWYLVNTIDEDHFQLQHEKLFFIFVGQEIADIDLIVYIRFVFIETVNL